MAVKGGESKQGLVVTLVFFILATIGLGVATYYGMADQDKLKKAAAEEKKKTDIANQERDYYLAWAGVLRSYLGSPAAPDSRMGRELAGNKTKIDQSSFNTYKDFPELKALVDKLATVAKWDPTNNQPATNFFALLKARDDEIKDLKTKLATLEGERKLAQDQRTATQTDRKNDKTAFDNSVTKVKNEFEGERVAFEKNIKDLEARLNKVEDKKDPIYAKLQDELEATKKERDAIQKKIKGFEEQVATLQTRVEHKSDDRPVELIPRGKIVRVHGNLRRATIDIGRAQNLKPGTTFTVYSLAPNGKPKVRSKGKVEVLSVGDATSEVAITHIFAPDDPGDPVTGKRKEIDVLSRDNTDPIVSGDVLINPLWNPNAETHVAIAGVVDFQGTGAINVHSFIRLLEKQNIRVDAYVDPADGTIKGPGLTRRTDFLILGNIPTGREPGVSKDDAVLKRIDDSSKKLLDSARLNAVSLINPRRFLQDTGLNIPRTVEHD
jgi:hypothetical protein